MVRVGTELSSLIAAVEANQIEVEFPTDNLTGLKHAKIHGFMCDEAIFPVCRLSSLEHALRCVLQRNPGSHGGLHKGQRHRIYAPHSTHNQL